MRNLLLISCISIALSGCIAMQEPKDVSGQSEQALMTVDKLKERPKVYVSDKPYVNPEPVLRAKNRHEWLKKKTVEIVEVPGAGSLPFSEIVRQIKAQGVNVASELPLSMFSYHGFHISKTDALTALEIITSSVGVDFVVEDAKNGQKPYVRIIPMQSSEYTMNIGNRKLAFSNKFEEINSQNTIGSALGGQGGNGQSGDSQSNSSSGSSGSGDEESMVSYEEDIWTDLEAEIEKMLTVKVPVERKEITPTRDLAQMRMQQMANGNNNEMFRSVKIGQVSINKSTGHVSVQAPKHIRNKIINYVERLDRRFSASIVVKGQVVLVSQTETESKGIDLSSFIEFANNEYGLALSNDVLGGVSVSMPSDTNQFFSAAAEGANGTLLGVTGADGLLQVFNAYVQSINNAKTILRPEITTSSGTIGQFSNTTTVLLENFQSNTTNNDGGSTSSTNNQLIPLDFGTTLKILPRYDLDKDIIRAQVALEQVLKNGTGTIEQFITSGSGTERVSTDYPIQERLSIKGEAVGRSGSMVILGGQEIVSYNTDNSGATGLKDSYVGGLFGKSSKTVERKKLYLVLFLKANTHTETSARQMGI